MPGICHMCEIESNYWMLSDRDSLCLSLTLQVCCQRHGNITDINNPREFAQLVGDGGCQQACGLKLPCGHICPRRCHADDPLHSQVRSWGSMLYPATRATLH